MFIRSISAFAIVYFLLLGSSAVAQPFVSKDSLSYPPAPLTEFRAAWVATVSNINWPSKPGLSTAQQQDEAIKLLDFLKAHHFNAVIFQIRPQADAFYESSLEPWSYFLTGKQGKEPDPFYDPLSFWIEAAHERGLELHVWLNPYRAHVKGGGSITESSMVKKSPGLVKPLNNGYWWYDPSKQKTQDHTAAVVRDIVERYNIDGIHFDDYFYPYPSYNKNDGFPDNESWTAYLKNGGTLSRSDWRRDGVNKFIHRIYQEIKSVKPYVKFGISPFGIWRPGYPSSITGFDQYEQLYADARLWLNNGWLDYFAPQLYWPINKIGQSFPVLLGWWKEENLAHRHLWPGINIGEDKSLGNVKEIMGQIMISRGMLPESKGVVHWSISSLTRNPALSKALIEGPYKEAALVPASPWLDSVPPLMPMVTAAPSGDLIQISWTHLEEQDVFHWVVYFQYGNNWSYKILTQKERSISLNIRNSHGPLTSVAVSAVDRTGNESVFELIPTAPSVADISATSLP